MQTSRCLAFGNLVGVVCVCPMFDTHNTKVVAVYSSFYKHRQNRFWSSAGLVEWKFQISIKYFLGFCKKKNNGQFFIKLYGKNFRFTLQIHPTLTLVLVHVHVQPATHGIDLEENINKFRHKSHAFDIFL